MSAQRTTSDDEQFLDILRTASKTRDSLPERKGDEPTISREQLDDALRTTGMLRAYIQSHQEPDHAGERTVAVKMIASIRARCRRDWQCNECECRFDIDFAAYQKGGELHGEEEGCCPECNSVDVEPAAGTLKSNL